MIEKCPVCGRDFEYMGTSWGYKRGSVKYCSWKCLRAEEKKEGVEPMRAVIPEEAKKAAIQAAIEGRDTKEELAKYTTNPRSMWQYIRKVLREKNPELYAKLPVERKRQEDKKPEQVPKKTVKAETVQKAIEKAPEEIRKPEAKMRPFAFKMLCIESPVTGVKYEYDPDTGFSMRKGSQWWMDDPKTLNEIMAEIPDAMSALGVEV